jgi:hypothetical protein
MICSTTRKRRALRANRDTAAARVYPSSMSKQRSAAVWMLVLSVFILISGYSALRSWADLGWSTRTAYSISFAAGVVVFASAAWLLASGSNALRAASYAAAAGGLVLALTQGLGLWFGALLCFTPG